MDAELCQKAAGQKERTAVKLIGQNASSVSLVASLGDAAGDVNIDISE